MDERSEALRDELARLRRRAVEDAQVLSDLRSVAERQETLDRLFSDLQHQLERVGRAAVITLVGATGAGKSTLLNALAGAELAAEGVDRPTTTEPVIFAPVDADLSDLLPSEGARRARVVRHPPGARGPWSSQVLVDAPDVNSVAAEHRSIVSELAERSDVLVAVMHHQSVMEEAAVSFLDEFRGRRGLIFVLNRTDELTESARSEIVEQIRRLAAERWDVPSAPVLAVSAAEVRGASGASDPDWKALQDALEELSRASTLQSVRRRNAVGTAARVQQEFRGVRDEVAADLEALPSEVRSGLAGLADRTSEEVAERLALRRADLGHLLTAEAAKRWDGPGGWSLRTGSLSTLGLGAGALIARRHPLLAIGSAAGGLAAGQVEKTARKRRLAQEEGLLPEAGEFTGWYREALASPRVRAVRLAREPEDLALPSAEEAREQAARGVEEAWNDLVQRDLPRAAEKSSLRFFRLLLDLPVYGMVGWVVFQAGKGFLNESYLGLDFLLNALLLLAVYLLTVRFLVHRGLRIRAAALLAGVTARARSALANWGDEAAAAVEAETRRRSGALDRLCDLEETWRTHLDAA